MKLEVSGQKILEVERRPGTKGCIEDTRAGTESKAPFADEFNQPSAKSAINCWKCLLGVDQTLRDARQILAVVGEDRVFDRPNVAMEFAFDCFRLSVEKNRSKL